MAVFVGGLVAAIVFYIAILGVGIWAGFKQKNSSEEEVMLAGRSIGLVVGLLTLVATWVGGGYINGVAECMFRSDLASCQMPMGYSLSLIVGALLFVKPLRDGNYITMLDPLQKTYGARTGSMMLIPAFLSDVLWGASVLNALGSSLMIILNIDMTLSVIASAVFAAAYTMAGGLYSVSYTDVTQMFFIVVGLALSLGFAYNNPSVSHSEMSSHNWVGHVEPSSAWTWIDNFLLLILGGTPGQAYVQRILSIKNTRTTHIVSVLAMFTTLAVAVPPALAGVTGRYADWENVPGFNRSITSEDAVNILPLVLRYLTPEWVGCFGLGAISAAAMASADACILSSSSMFSRNIYKVIIRPKASEREVLWVLRFCVVVVTVLAVSIGLTVTSIYYLSILSTDLVYVVLFPNLLLVVHWPKAVNSYGCHSSFAVGVFVRLMSGEPALGLPAIIKWPVYDLVYGTQRFPFKTASMLCTLVTSLVVSHVARICFESYLVSADRWDVLGAFPHCQEGNLMMQMWPRSSTVLEGAAGKFSYENSIMENGSSTVLECATGKSSYQNSITENGSSTVFEGATGKSSYENSITENGSSTVLEGATGKSRYRNSIT